jgi:dCTP deaminase
MKITGRDGVLASQHLLEAIDEGVITGGGYTIPPQNVQPASLDLRLGETAYRVQCSFLPGAHQVERKLKDLIIDEFDLHKEGIVLEPMRPYLIPLKERLELPEYISARANPKSSTGRLDVFTRVITDGSYQFDDIRAGYVGGLYLEVVPLSFPIRVKEGLALNQLRLSVGQPTMRDEEIQAIHQETPILFTGDGVPFSKEDLPLDNGLFLSLDLQGGRSRRVGYRARDTAPLLDMTKTSREDPDRYWEPVNSEGDHIILKQERFYLLMSNEAVAIPPGIASEMTAYDPTNGELRTHYAGFFDPGFGYDQAETFHGSKAALEVRAHDVSFMIDHGQRVCKLTFEKMLEPPLMLYGYSGRSSYQQQLGPLGKHFSQPAAVPTAPEAAIVPAVRDENQLELPIDAD